MPTWSLREATDLDVVPIAEIYNHYILTSTATFEEAPVNAQAMTARLREIKTAQLPYVVACEANGTIVGFAYAAPYRQRIAYRHTVENSVYVRDGCGGRGIGRGLMTALIEACQQRGLREMVGVIGDSDNQASLRLHLAMGFVEVGTLQGVGFKFGRWVDTVLVQRSLQGKPAHSEQAVLSVPDNNAAS